MSASIPSLLADELDTSPEKAQKLLLAMLREVKKRARHEGVRLPDLGTFREANGEITFEPSPSLARAVNQRFEGLESEDLGTAPSRESDAQDEEDEGPNTITLGYQDSDWSPLDSEEGDGASETDDDDEADTEEFQVPDADEAADTEELQSPEPATDETTMASSDDASDAADQPTTETEELYPLVEDVSEEEETAEDEPVAATDSNSGGSPPARPTSEEEHDSLSGIWDDDEEDADEPHDTGFDPFDTEPEPLAEADASEDAESDEDAESRPAFLDSDPPEDVEVEAETQAPPESPDPADSEKSRSTGARVAVSLLVVLLLGGATWYLLGRRGTVQPPQKAFAQLQAQVQPQLQKLSGLVGSGSDTETGSPPSATAEVGASTQTASTEGQNSTTTDPAASESDDGAPAARGLTPSAGGWTIIVASRTQRGPAEALVQKYRTAFADRNLPVGILTGEVNNQTRYRVGVGQFDSQDEARRALEEASNTLPNGAWPLQLQ
jgi:hypothetical protein